MMITPRQACPPDKFAWLLGRRWGRRWRWGMACLLLGGAFFAGTRWPHLPWLAKYHLKATVAATPQYLTGARNYVNSALHAESLPTVILDMKFKFLARIEAQRATALEEGWLRSGDDDFVPAQLAADGYEKVPVEIRLKGDRIAHIKGDKWSFRVKIKGEQRPFGMRTFSLQDPSTRFFLNEWLFLNNVRQEGIMAVRYRFVRLIFNGQDKGIYALEEHFTKELIEAHGRREGVIVAFEERPTIHMEIARRGCPGDDLTTRLSAIESQDIRTFDSKHLENHPALVAQRNEALELLRAFQEGRRRPSEVFDVELMGRYMAVMDLYKGEHALLWQNSRFYYNPITARLEPLGFDVYTLLGDRPMALFANYHDDRYISGPLRDPAIAQAYLRSLRRISSNEYLQQMQSATRQEFDRWKLVLFGEFPLQPLLNTDIWEKIARQQDYIRSALSPAKLIIATAIKEPAAPSTDLGAVTYNVDIRSIALLPVEITDFQIDDGPWIPATAVWSGRNQSGVWKNANGSVSLSPGSISAGEDDWPIVATFRLTLPDRPTNVASEPPKEPTGTTTTGSPQPVVKIRARLIGEDHVCVTEARPFPPRSAIGSRPQAPTVEEVLRQHSFLHCTGQADVLSVRPGCWNVAGDLVLPEGMALEISPGTTLRFEPQAALIAEGPLRFKGTADRPIILEAAQDQWAGVAVLDAGADSDWKNVAVRHTAGIERGGWMFTGGVTFYQSPIDMTGVTFESAGTEDALNIVHARMRLSGCTFTKCVSDAFDGDYVQGEVRGCRFEDIHGDAVDVSGSTISVTELTAAHIGDKVISAGEGSDVTADDIQAEQVGIAAVSKDSSVLHLDRVRVRDARIGLAAYRKKEVYGPGQIIARRVDLNETPRQSLVQTGSSIELDGAELAARDLDISALYRDGTLGN